MKKIVTLIYFVLIFSKLEAQVKLQTGVPDINFPLYSVSDANNRLNAGVSLTYTGGNGINVDDPGSCVGTGWDLKYGGCISRQQVGEPDDQMQTGSFNVFGLGPSVINSNNTTLQNGFNVNTAFNKYVTQYFPNGYLYSEFNPNDVITDGGAYNYTTKCEEQSLTPPKYLADRQIDVFTFDLNGRVGKFLIGRDANHTLLFLNQADSKLKIQVQFDPTLLSQNIRTTIKGFTVTDEKGIQYVFQDRELTEVIQYTTMQLYNSVDGTPYSQATLIPLAQNIIPNVCPIPLLMNGTYPSLFNYTSYNSTTNFQFKVYEGTRTGQYTCNKWMLTRIINPLTQKTIEFTYNTETVVTNGTHSVLLAELNNTSTINVYINLYSSIFKKPALIYNQYGDKVEFIYGSARLDLPGNTVLSKINFYKDNLWVSDEEFNYGYFFKSIVRNFTDNFTAQEIPFLRLSLLQFQKRGQNNTLEPPCLFGYYTSTGTGKINDIVPPQFTFYKDFWGYYNGIADYTTDALAATPSGSIYSYGIYSAMLFQSNIFKNPSLLAQNGMIKSITYPTGGSLTYSYELNNVSYNGENTIAGGVRVNSVIKSDNINIADNLITNYAYLLSDEVTSSGWGYNAPVNTESKMVRLYNGCSGNVPTCSAKSASLTLEKLAPINSNIFMSSFWEGTNPYVVIAINLLNLYYVLFPPQVSLYSDYTETFFYSDAINFNNTLPQMYSRVEITNVNGNNNNGKTVYSFTSSSDYSLEEPNDIPLHTMKQRFGYWRYGLLKTKEIYNSENLVNPIYKISNTYNADPTVYNTNSNYLSQNWAPTEYLTLCTPYYNMNIDSPDPAGTPFTIYLRNNLTGTSNIPLIPNNINSVTYSPFSGVVNLIQSVESTLDANGNLLTKTTNYNYNSNNFLVSTIQYKSSGEKLETDYTYSNDYSSSITLISIMQGSNNITAPILTERYIYPDGVTKYLISGTINEYGLISNNDIKVINRYDFRSASPVLNSALLPISNSQIVRDPNYYILNSQFGYDNNGTLNQVLTEGNKISSTLYDDSSPDFLWAKVANASASDIAYTSFETNGTGNWSFLPSNITSTVGAISGSNAYNLSTGISTINTLSSSNIYTLSFWVNGAMPTITGTIASSGGLIQENSHFAKIKSLNGWDLYMGSITGVTGVSITNTGSTTYIDELRLYPANAFMKTSTFNVIKGKTADIDVNNNITSFVYDDLARLKLILDQNGNILKKIDYEFQQQQTSITSSVTATTIPITICCNGSGNSWGVQLTNTTTGQIYYASIPITSSYDIGTSFNVAPGIYNISIYWAYMGVGTVNGPTGGDHLLVFGTYNQAGTQSSMNLAGITISSPVSIAIPF